MGETDNLTHCRHFKLNTVGKESTVSLAVDTSSACLLLLVGIARLSTSLILLLLLLLLLR